MWRIEVRRARTRTWWVWLIGLALLAGCAPPAGNPNLGCASGDLPAPPPFLGLKYGAASNHVADVYPACTEFPVGAIMVMPGGGYTEHSSIIASPQVQRLRDRGWIVMNVRYRLAPLNQWAAQGEDMRLAITWWRSSASFLFGAESLPLVGMGWSAGGHLAEWATVRTDGAHFDAGVSVAGGTFWPDRAGSPAGQALFGFSPSTAVLLDASTVPHLDAGDPPVLHVHAANDSVVPVAQANLLAQRIATNGDPTRHSVVIDPSCGHSIVCLTPERIDPFLDALLPSPPGDPDDDDPDDGDAG